MTLQEMKASLVHKEVLSCNRGMKNKKLSYFLIAVVAVLWGLIIYRVVGALTAEDETNSMPAAAPTVKEIYNDFDLPKDTAKLLLNYRDPFGLIKEKDTIAVKSDRPMMRKISSVVAKPAMNWSFITYSGYIRNPSTNKLIALVNINGQSATLSEGEIKNQVKLIKNLRDSIKVSYQGKTKFISIKSGSQ